MIHTSDSLQKFVFEHAPIRGEVVRLDATFRAVLERRSYPEPLQRLLGEFMAAAALLASTLKFDGRLILQVESPGPLKLLMVECSSERTLRGLAQWRGDLDHRPFAELASDGRLAITIEQRDAQAGAGAAGDRESVSKSRLAGAAKLIRHQGIVSLEGESVARAIERYFANSEQLDTRLWLTTEGGRAAGMLLQRLPGEFPDADLWSRAVLLGDTLTQRELLGLPVQDLLHRLYHEEDVRLFSGVPLSFRCSCSRARVEGVLRMLGHEEVRSILAERGKVDVDCEFCGGHYAFDPVDAEQLFASDVVTPAPAARH
jgi:molecular chaperone Hsp33